MKQHKQLELEAEHNAKEAEEQRNICKELQQQLTAAHAEAQQAASQQQQ